MRRSSGSLDKIARSVRKVTATRKHELPLIKLAIFGDQWSPSGKSLRWDGNVVAVTGVEGDYDGEVMPPEEAREFDSRRNVVRHPRETKGEQFRETQLPGGDSCSETGGDCC